MDRRRFLQSSLELLLSPRFERYEPILLVPAYFYPTGEGRKSWERMIASASRVPIEAIANVNSGPGSKIDPIYSEILDRAGQGGVTLLGYISTSYGKRPMAEILKDAALWVEFYPSIRGFFLDEQASAADRVEFYDEIAVKLRALVRKARLVANPGTLCDESYVKRRTSDRVCLFESREGFPEFSPPPWARDFPPDRFAAIPYEIKGIDAMRRAVAHAASSRVGAIYVTDATGVNPYDRLPTYWDEEVEAVVKLRRG